MAESLQIEWQNNTQNFEEQSVEISVLKSFYENTDDFEVIQEASMDDSKLNTIQLKIKVECTIKPINVEIYLPIEKVNKDAVTKNGDDKTQPKLERSISGYHATTRIKCESIPPLTLNIVMPVTYPSDNQPIFTLSGFWLNKQQLCKLCTQLDLIGKDYNGMTIVYTWVEWLQMNTLKFLEVLEEADKLIVTPFGQYTDGDSKYNDSRAFTTFDDIEHCIYEFLRFNYLEELKEFKIKTFSCPLCFDDKYGSECFRMSTCKHVFCSECLIACCEIHVKDGSIQNLKCPEVDCKELIPEEILQLVLTEEEYERWERLLLQRTLESMQDVIYCPRCSIAVVLEGNEDTHGYCMSCRFDFCTLCKDQFHIGKCDSAQEKVEKRIKSLNLTADQLLNLNDQQIREQFRNSDVVVKLKEKVQKDLNVIKTQDFLGKFKLCPKCRATVDKFEGCNKVTCRCGAIFCYVCGRSITGYEHFNATNAKCNLWNHTVGAGGVINRVPERELHQGQRVINRILDLAPNQQRNAINCPTCGQKCLKMERNNHIKCWLCQTNFCFCCKSKILGIVTSHFKAGGLCKQHSD